MQQVTIHYQGANNKHRKHEFNNVITMRGDTVTEVMRKIHELRYWIETDGGEELILPQRVTSVQIVEIEEDGGDESKR